DRPDQNRLCAPPSLDLRAGVRKELARYHVCAFHYGHGAGRHYPVERGALGRRRASDSALDRRVVWLASGRNGRVARLLPDYGGISEYLRDGGDVHDGASQQSVGSENRYRYVSLSG